MGDYECINCNEIFHRDEPPYDGYTLCELCSFDFNNLTKEKETTND